MARKVGVAGLMLGAAFAALVFWPRESRADETLPDDLPLPDLPDFPIPEIEIADPLGAFLYMIRSCENRQVSDYARYSRMYGNSVFTDFSDHPVLTGEKTGVPLSPAMCRAAGYGVGCVSTAAGAYQIIAPTWQRVRKAGAWGPYLPDFGPESQDEAARRLLIECGALPRLKLYDVQGAIARAAPVWASLPGSRANQGAVSIDVALNYFVEGGGVA